MVVCCVGDSRLMLSVVEVAVEGKVDLVVIRKGKEGQKGPVTTQPDDAEWT